MSEPKHLIDRAVSTEDEGLQELRDRLAPTEVSDSTLDHLREVEEAKQQFEERSHWRWLGMAVRNLLVWLAAIGAFMMVAVDAIIHFGSNKHG